MAIVVVPWKKVQSDALELGYCLENFGDIHVTEISTSEFRVIEEMASHYKTLGQALTKRALSVFPNGFGMPSGGITLVFDEKAAAIMFKLSYG